MRISTANPHDIPMFHGIMKKSLPHNMWSLESLQGIMSERGCVFLKAEDAGGQILGFSLTRVVADEAELLSIAVDEKHRGKGIALAMLEETLVQTKKLGAAKIFLEVAVDNDSAIGLYKKAGFKIIGKRPAYYSRGGGDTSATDAWVMGLELFLPL